MSSQRCDCSDCKFGARLRGIIRRGDKKEMRSLIREMHDMLEFMEEELDNAHHFIHHLTHGDEEHQVEKKIYLN